MTGPVLADAEASGVADHHLPGKVHVFDLFHQRKQQIRLPFFAHIPFCVPFGRQLVHRKT
jgi:hypothetical protein